MEEDRDLTTLQRSLQTLKQNFKEAEPVPDDSICPQCNKLLGDHPDYQRMLDDRGLTAEMPRVRGATCSCDAQEATRTREQSMADSLRVGTAELPHQGAGQKPCTFGNWKKNKDNIGPTLAFAQNEGPAVLVMVGVTGCGKSHLLEAIGRRGLALGQTVKYVTTQDYIQRIRSSYGSENHDPIVDECFDVDILLLDEVGAESNSSASTQSELERLVDHRLRNGKRLAVATNLGIAEMEAKLGDRMASRLWDTGTGAVAHLILKAPDYRRTG